jgi:heat shock protein HtpX
MLNVYEAVSANKRKSAFIVLVFLLFTFLAVYFISKALGIYLGYQPGGFGYFGLALIISGISSFAGYYYSDRIILKISRARPADRDQDFDFFTVSENLAIASGLPKPTLYVIDDPSPNAFATGRDPSHAVICATKGLLQKLNRTELEGVVAHEMGHIKNYDTRLQSVVAVLVGIVTLLGDWFLRMRYFGREDRDRDNGGFAAVFLLIGIIFAIASPIVAQLIQLAISRRREFLADSSSVALTKQPSGLISALKKISSDPVPLREANNATAHLFIVNPFKNSSFKKRFSGIFNTHPPINERIKALKAML